MNSFNYIDLFCGIGGFHQAMESLGGKCVFACDIDEDCRKTYKANYGLEPAGDITKIDAKDIPAHDVLCGGFPCQAFSKAGKRLGFEDPTKGTLFFDLLRIMKYHKPKYALLENVRNLASHDNGNTWQVIHDSLKDIGYNLVDKPVIFSPHYMGIPQHRERVYIMCVRADIGDIPPFNFNETNYVPCNIESILQNDDDIENIEKYRLSADKENLLNLWDEFVKNIKCNKLPAFPIFGNRISSGKTMLYILRTANSLIIGLRRRKNVLCSLVRRQSWSGRLDKQQHLHYGIIFFSSALLGSESNQAHISLHLSQLLKPV